MLPYISLHSDAVVSMLSQKSKPYFNCFRMAIMYLDKTPQGDPLKILLTLLVNKITPRNCPAFGDPRQRYGTKRREVQIVCRSQCKVGKEFHIPHVVGSQLQIATWTPVKRFSFQRFQVYCLYTSGHPSDVILGNESIFMGPMLPLNVNLGVSKGSLTLN